jgi:hypothetical protein
MTTPRFVSRLPDLITPEDYQSTFEGSHVKLRLRVTDDGLELLGDSMNPAALDALLALLEPEEIEMVLCG